MNPVINQHIALIMAGGQGTRFWPMSSEKRPKQFLPITSEKALILETFDRLKQFIPPEHIFIVADGRYRPQITDALPEFRADNLIAEPSPRNTAPCLIYANIFLSRRYENANLIVVPADHTTVHQHPLAVLEVRRILLEHLTDVESFPAVRNAAAGSATSLVR